MPNLLHRWLQSGQAYDLRHIVQHTFAVAQVVPTGRAERRRLFLYAVGRAHHPQRTPRRARPVRQTSCRLACVGWRFSERPRPSSSPLRVGCCCCRSSCRVLRVDLFTHQPHFTRHALEYSRYVIHLSCHGCKDTKKVDSAKSFQIFQHPRDVISIYDLSMDLTPCDPMAVGMYAHHLLQAAIKLTCGQMQIYNDAANPISRKFQMARLLCRF